MLDLNLLIKQEDYNRKLNLLKQIKLTIESLILDNGHSNRSSWQNFPGIMSRLSRNVLAILEDGILVDTDSLNNQNPALMQFVLSPVSSVSASSTNNYLNRTTYDDSISNGTTNNHRAVYYSTQAVWSLVVSVLNADSLDGFVLTQKNKTLEEFEKYARKDFRQIYTQLLKDQNEALNNNNNNNNNNNGNDESSISNLALDWISYSLRQNILLNQLIYLYSDESLIKSNYKSNSFVLDRSFYEDFLNYLRAYELRDYSILKKIKRNFFKINNNNNNNNLIINQQSSQMQTSLAQASIVDLAVSGVTSSSSSSSILATNKISSDTYSQTLLRNVEKYQQRTSSTLSQTDSSLNSTGNNYINNNTNNSLSSSSSILSNLTSPQTSSTLQNNGIDSLGTVNNSLVELAINELNVNTMKKKFVQHRRLHSFPNIQINLAKRNSMVAANHNAAVAATAAAAAANAAISTAPPQSSATTTIKGVSSNESVKPTDTQIKNGLYNNNLIITNELLNTNRDSPNDKVIFNLKDVYESDLYSLKSKMNDESSSWLTTTTTTITSNSNDESTNEASLQSNNIQSEQSSSQKRFSIPTLVLNNQIKRVDDLIKEKQDDSDLIDDDIYEKANVFDFIHSQQINCECSQLDKENSHFIIADITIASIEIIKTQELDYEYENYLNNSSITIDDLLNRNDLINQQSNKRTSSIGIKINQKKQTNQLLSSTNNGKYQHQHQQHQLDQTSNSFNSCDLPNSPNPNCDDFVSSMEQEIFFGSGFTSPNQEVLSDYSATNLLKTEMKRNPSLTQSFSSVNLNQSVDASNDIDRITNTTTATTATNTIQSKLFKSQSSVNIAEMNKSFDSIAETNELDSSSNQLTLSQRQLKRERWLLAKRNNAINESHVFDSSHNSTSTIDNNNNNNNNNNSIGQLLHSSSPSSSLSSSSYLLKSSTDKTSLDLIKKSIESNQLLNGRLSIKSDANNSQQSTDLVENENVLTNGVGSNNRSNSSKSRPLDMNRLNSTQSDLDFEIVQKETPPSIDTIKVNRESIETLKQQQEQPTSPLSQENAKRLRRFSWEEITNLDTAERISIRLIEKLIESENERVKSKLDEYRANDRVRLIQVPNLRQYEFFIQYIEFYEWMQILYELKSSGLLDKYLSPLNNSRHNSISASSIYLSHLSSAHDQQTHTKHNKLLKSRGSTLFGKSKNSEKSVSTKWTMMSKIKTAALAAAAAISIAQYQYQEETNSNHKRILVANDSIDLSLNSTSKDSFDEKTKTLIRQISFNIHDSIVNNKLENPNLNFPVNLSGINLANSMLATNTHNDNAATTSTATSPGSGSNSSRLVDKSDTISLQSTTSSVVNSFKNLNARIIGDENWAPVRDQLILNQTPKQKRLTQMIQQNFRCADCGIQIKQDKIKTFNYCEYFCKYFCRCCHINNTSYIPAYIINSLDFRTNYLVSKKAKNFLEKIYSEPVITLDSLNPSLFDHQASIFAKIKKLRLKLYNSKSYINSCRFAVDIKQNLFSQFEDFIINDYRVYSIETLFKIRKTNYYDQFKLIVNQIIEHIKKCELCSQQGYICGICNQNKELLYPFDLDKVEKCPNCLACYHKNCLRNPEQCPRCKRKRNRINTTSGGGGGGGGSILLSAANN